MAEFSDLDMTPLIVRNMLEREIENLRRHYDAQLLEVRETAKLASETPGATVALQEHLERVVTEQQRAIEIAEREREQAARVLREEQHIASNIASQEREKAAENLRTQLASQIVAGDTNLREHIQQQIQQIRSALVSAEQLELSRIEKAVQEMVCWREQAKAEYMAIRKEHVLIHDASQQAINKAETATERRFDAVNAFREQLTVQTSSFMPREVAEARVEEIRQQLTAITTRLDTQSGKSLGSTSAIGYMVTAATLLISLIVLVANQVV